MMVVTIIITRLWRCWAREIFGCMRFLATVNILRTDRYLRHYTTPTIRGIEAPPQFKRQWYNPRPATWRVTL